MFCANLETVVTDAPLREEETSTLSRQHWTEELTVKGWLSFSQHQKLGVVSEAKADDLEALITLDQVKRHRSLPGQWH